MPAPIFTSNFPTANGSQPILLTTPERTGALATYSGRGVVIAFVDAGFYPHPDLGGRILLHANAATRRIVEETADFATGELSWHGQMTTVIACGDGRTSNGRYRGIASGANLVLVRVATPRGQVKETDILRGLRWILDTHRRLGIRIVNISVGGDVTSDDPDHPLHRIVRKLAEAGLIVVVASGNRPYRYLLPPASAAEAIVVGGLDDHNSTDPALWTNYHHNYGLAYDGSPRPDILAPAVWVASPIMPGTLVAREARWLGPLLQAPDDEAFHHLLGQGYADLGLSRATVESPDPGTFMLLQQRIHSHKLIDTHHQHVDGTSVAAPIVSSVIAQMLEANPRLTLSQIRAILASTARPLVGVKPVIQGWGALNAAAAVQAALAQA